MEFVFLLMSLVLLPCRDVKEFGAIWTAPNSRGWLLNVAVTDPYLSPPRERSVSSEERGRTGREGFRSAAEKVRIKTIGIGTRQQNSFTAQYGVGGRSSANTECKSGTPQPEKLPLFPFGISSDGSTVVGFHNSDPVGEVDKGVRTPCYWTRTAGLLRLGTGRFPQGEADKCSADGSVIVGAVYSEKESFIAIWKDGKGPKLVAKGSDSGISGDGKWVVGSTNGRPFKWSDSTGVRFLPTLPNHSRMGYANVVSFDGSTIAGCLENGKVPDEARRGTGQTYAIQPEQSLQACIWQGDNPPVDIKGHGEYWIEPTAISSDASRVVGIERSNRERKTFLWSKYGGIRWVKGLDGFDLGVHGMSSDGNIIYGICARGTTKIKNGAFQVDNVGTIWIHGQPIRADLYMWLRGVSVLPGQAPDSVVGCSADGDALVVQHFVSQGVIESWIVDFRRESATGSR